MPETGNPRPCIARICSRSALSSSGTRRRAVARQPRERRLGARMPLTSSAICIQAKPLIVRFPGATPQLPATQIAAPRQPRRRDLAAASLAEQWSRPTRVLPLRIARARSWRSPPGTIARAAERPDGFTARAPGATRTRMGFNAFSRPTATRAAASPEVLASFAPAHQDVLPGSPSTPRFKPGGSVRPRRRVDRLRPTDALHVDVTAGSRSSRTSHARVRGGGIHAHPTVFPSLFNRSWRRCPTGWFKDRG